VQGGRSRTHALEMASRWALGVVATYCRNSAVTVGRPRHRGLHLDGLDVLGEPIAYGASGEAESVGDFVLRGVFLLVQAQEFGFVDAISWASGHACILGGEGKSQHFCMKV
jgi:hypothetical protein